MLLMAVAGAFLFGNGSVGKVTISMLRKLLVNLMIVVLVAGLFLTACQDTGKDRLNLTKEEKAWLDEHPVLSLGVDPEFAPYEFVDEQGRHTGAAADYMRLISQRLGVELRMASGLSWEEVMNHSRQRRMDVVAAVTKTPERSKFLKFTQPYLHYTIVIVTNENYPTVSGISSFAGKSVALVKGYAYTELALQHQPDIKPLYVDTVLDGLNAVITGEAEAIASDLGSLAYQIQQQNLLGLKVNTLTELQTQGLRIGVRDDYPLLVSILDKALDSITPEEHQQIRQRWVGIEMPEEIAPTVTLTSEERQWLEQHPTIRTAIDPSWAPVEFVDEEGIFQGISADYLKWLEGLLGVKFEVAKELSWQEAMVAFKRGEVDIFTSIRRTSEREEFFEFTDTYTSFPIVIFTGPEVPFIGSMKELDGRRVGVVEGYAIHELLVANYPTIELITTLDTVEALKMLSRGELDAYVGNLLVTSYYLSRLGYTHIKVAGETPYQNNQSMGVRKDWPILASILNKAINAIPAAERNAIYSRWVSVRYERGFDYDLLWKVLAGVAVLFAIFIYWNRRLAGLNRQLVISRNEAEVANRVKSTFLATMSHELRTPLNSIIGFTGIILQGMSGKVNEEQGKQLTMVKNSANHLLSLINDILDTSKIEAGMVELSLKEFSLDNVVREVVETLSPAASEKGLEVLTEVPEVITLTSDKRWVKQVLMNLVSNAVKFTDQGSVKIAARVPGDENLEVRVIDTGVGIKKEDMDKLFLPFQQLDVSLTKKHGGTGLGLHLTKKLVTLLGGDISAKSEYGRGSEFTFTIPLRYQEEKRNEEDTGG